MTVGYVDGFGVGIGMVRTIKGSKWCPSLDHLSSVFLSIKFAQRFGGHGHPALPLSMLTLISLSSKETAAEPSVVNPLPTVLALRDISDSDNILIFEAPLNCDLCVPVPAILPLHARGNWHLI
ncbi:hypothetical protein I7I50_11117 [Histoplasma capsulatum G186AR]|uniref:Uncharacterized protein n=1 Tax=Ajellomyces capsulatus TaxID=5037 RepID=A0A8H7ZAB8_AJECA|nr:hypothetical protein I7I52_02356 [Histoplasma capsulatum]QSS69723.1 hypothetical protein I7I50_11117 [Histoplasma capsulatum G186AR]